MSGIYLQLRSTSLSELQPISLDHGIHMQMLKCSLFKRNSQLSKHVQNVKNFDSLFFFLMISVTFIAKWIYSYVINELGFALCGVESSTRKVQQHTLLSNIFIKLDAKTIFVESIFQKVFINGFIKPRPSTGSTSLQCVGFGSWRSEPCHFVFYWIVNMKENNYLRREHQIDLKLWKRQLTIHCKFLSPCCQFRKISYSDQGLPSKKTVDLLRFR